MLKPETIKANTPISHKKSELFIDLANLYNALVGSQKLTELFTPKMQGISDEIEKFQEGAWLHSKPIDPADGSLLSQVAAKLIPCHRRKRSLFTNLVAFVNAAGESNELGDLSVSSTEMDKGLVEYDESLKNLEATLFRVTNGIIVPSEEDAKELAENIVQPTNEDETATEEDEFVEVLTLKVKKKFLNDHKNKSEIEARLDEIESDFTWLFDENVKVEWGVI